ncbi:hypothetical protein [Piscibacillus salipiscarius]|uniref:DUF4355 domain-containing protein n=1 Tax=Piscibacillus salipiscarius TaxID=299480 RepID=A0ABW5Q9B2_9BACI|nr:hypothetical protein [Piscibacillus salipiscarius]
MAEENTFTQEQVDEAIQNAKTEWTEQELDPIVTERDELLQYKPKELTEEEKALAEKEQNLFKREVNATLKENGLEQFADVVKVQDEEELNQAVKSLNQIVNDIKTSVGYVPQDHATDDEYSKFEKDKDTKGMIGTKLTKLFG